MGACLLGVGGRLALDPYLSGVPFITLFGGIVITAFFAGFWPAMLTTALGAIAHFALETTVAPTAGQGALILLLGLGPTGIAFWLWDIGTKRGDIAVLGTLSYAAPLLSTLALIFAGRAVATPTLLVAAILITGGAVLAARASLVKSDA